MKSSVLQLVRVFDGEKGRDGANFSIATDYDTILRFIKTQNENTIEWDWSPSTFQLSLLDAEGRPINWTGERYKEDGNSFRPSEPQRRIFLTLEANGAVQTNGETQTNSTVIQVNLHEYESFSDVGADTFRSVFKIQDSALIGAESGTELNHDLLIIDLEKLMQVAPGESLGESTTLQELLYSLRSMAQMSNLTLKFSVRVENLQEVVTAEASTKEVDDVSATYNVSAFLTIRAGLSTEMAQFSVNAGSITAAVQEAGLEFSADGLTVRNGNFSIIDGNNQKVLSADEAGNLLLSGFIDAKGGTIGGFNITERELVSTGGEEGKKVVLNGTAGSITAYGLSIQEGSIDGALKIGNLILQAPGADNLIIHNKKNGEDSNPNFSLTNDGILNVRNAHINGILSASTIQTATFEKGSVSAIDGVLVLLSNTTNFNIKEVVKDTGATWKATIKVDGEGPWDKIQKEGWVVFATNNDSIIGQVKFISEDLTTFEILTERNPDGAKILYYLGEQSSTPIIGINGGNTSQWNSTLHQKALSIFKPGVTSPILLLGDLTPVTGELKDKDGGILPPRYGLYCDDVILKGSLQTSYKDSEDTGNMTIAGMDTNVDSGDSIVLWAGQTLTGERKDAPFTVTRDGKVYASYITLVDGVFTNSIIEGGSIKTATVIGANKYDMGLRFINTGSKGGIGFYNAVSEDLISDSNLTLGISDKSFYTHGNDLESETDFWYDFIKLDMDEVHFRGTDFKTIKKDKYLVLKEDYLGFSTKEDDTLLSSIYLTNTGVGIGAREQASAHMYIAQNDSYLNTETVHMKSRVEFGEKMLYRQVEGNYMLYVYEEVKG